MRVTSPRPLRTLVVAVLSAVETLLLKLQFFSSNAVSFISLCTHNIGKHLAPQRLVPPWKPTTCRSTCNPETSLPSFMNLRIKRTEKRIAWREKDLMLVGRRCGPKLNTLQPAGDCRHTAVLMRAVPWATVFRKQQHSYFVFHNDLLHPRYPIYNKSLLLF